MSWPFDRVGAQRPRENVPDPFFPFSPVIDRLWNPFIAAWFEGKDDPKLVLLRFDAEDAQVWLNQVWLNENNLLAGVKMLLGGDPKKDYADKVADVDLR